MNNNEIIDELMMIEVDAGAVIEQLKSIIERSRCTRAKLQPVSTGRSINQVFSDSQVIKMVEKRRNKLFKKKAS